MVVTVPIRYWEFTGKNVTSLSRTIDVIVPSGTYYRVRGYHAASNDGLKESASTTYTVVS